MSLGNDTAVNMQQKGHAAGQEAYAHCKGPGAPYGSKEWQHGYMRGWVFAALRDQERERQTDAPGDPIHAGDLRLISKAEALELITEEHLDMDGAYDRIRELEAEIARLSTPPSPINKQELRATIVQIIAEESAETVDENDSPMIGRKGMKRAQRIGDRILKRIEEISRLSSPADVFAALMWGMFVDGASMDGADLQDALLKSGMAETRVPTPEELDGFGFDMDVDDDEAICMLTPAGAACVERGRGRVE